ncbi:type IV pilus modification PilV family protein [Paenibacillus thermotolerans]|uniref:type IV pilus modification PilV family protein n=1 Tax=Paenibacillus thermotolerans TaxID=3027807 RepID=UPI0023675D63|nr:MULTISPECIES: type II secretion system protein [unclassified Paenibacillus]
MRLMNRLSNERGFTLLEVLGSLVVLTIFIAAIVHLFGYLRLADSAGDRLREALLHAERISNEIRAEIQALRKAGVTIDWAALGYSSIPAPNGFAVTANRATTALTPPSMTNGVS